MGWESYRVGGRPKRIRVHTQSPPMCLQGNLGRVRAEAYCRVDGPGGTIGGVWDRMW